MLQRLRQSVRLLFNSPAATGAAILSLALGIGANTTIFSLIDAVVLRPLPVSRPEELVAIANAEEMTVSYPVYRDLAAGSRTLTGLAAFAPRTGSIAVGRTAAVGDVQVVSGNYFDVLGVRATPGRTIAVSDDRAGAEPVVVLSSAFWRQSLGGDPSIVGRRVLINGSAFTVIGVAPEGFRGVTLGANPPGWIPVAAWPRMATGRYLKLRLEMRGWGWLRMVGRMRTGVAPEQVRAELNALAAAQSPKFSKVQKPFQVSVTPLRTAATGVRSRADLTRFVTLLVGVVLAVLGIACANVSGLLLARTLARRRELAIRAALGASRRRIVAEMLLDGALLAALGASVALLTAMWAIDLLQKIRLPGGIDMSRVDVGVSGVAVAATAGVAVLAAVLFGLGPALQSTRGDVVSALKDQPIAGRLSRQYTRGVLVAVQVTLSLVLLVGTALFARTLQTTLASDLGFNPRNLAYAATNVSLQRYEGGRAAAFYRQALERMRATPGVTTAAWTRLIPSGDSDVESVDVPGYAPPGGGPAFVGVNVVTSGYFRAMGISIVRGREFVDADAERATPVVVVSQAAAARFWNGDALGRRFTIQNVDVTVIGVARDVPPAPGTEPQPFVYGNAFQLPDALAGFACLVVRTETDPAAMVPAIRSVLQAAAPGVPVLEARTMEEQLFDLLGPQRSAAALLGLLSIIALGLSGAGIYAMVAFWVAQRTREFGVRRALGGSASAIRALAMRQAVFAVLIGIAAGLPIAFVLGQTSRRMLFALSPMDPISYAVAVAVLSVVALGASFVPARRASRVSPVEALRAGTE